MKKYLVSLSLFLLPHVALRTPDIPLMPDKDLPRMRTERSLMIYSDADCTRQGIDVSVNQTICVKVETASDQEAKGLLTLLNSQKEELLRLTMNKQGNYYKVIFNAPIEAGLYYIHVEIKGEGLSYSGERNVNVGEGVGPQNVNSNVKAESKVIVSEKKIDDEMVLAAEDLAENNDQVEMEEEISLNWLGAFFLRILSFLGFLF